MGWLIEIALGICLIILAGGLVNWINIHMSRRSALSGRDSDAAENLNQRLADVERRLTDVQDVMIALSEKLDRWEEQSGCKASSGRT